jgi:hypothetical protein
MLCVLLFVRGLVIDSMAGVTSVEWQRLNNYRPAEDNRQIIMKNLTLGKINNNRGILLALEK